jgi:hypothetical protein
MEQAWYRLFSPHASFLVCSVVREDRFPGKIRKDLLIEDVRDIL